MPGVGEIARALLRRAVQETLAYRSTMFLWAVWGIIQPLVTMAVWTTAAGPKAIAGFSQEEFAAYFLVGMLVHHLTIAWDMEVFGWMIRSGQLSGMLLRPMLPVWNHVANNVAFKLVTAMMMAPAWVVLGFAIRADWSGVSLASLALALPAVLLAAALNFVWGYCVAMIAFWTTKATAINSLYWTGGMLLGGRLAPLAVLPPALGALAQVLPFQVMFGFPVEVAMGRLGPDLLLRYFGLQIAWLLAGLVTWRLIWNAGIRQYSAVGA
jgi:ABC-2 type transport system permease protein